MLTLSSLLACVELQVTCEAFEKSSRWLLAPEADIAFDLANRLAPSQDVQVGGFTCMSSLLVNVAMLSASTNSCQLGASAKQGYRLANLRCGLAISSDLSHSDPLQLPFLRASRSQICSSELTTSCYDWTCCVQHILGP